MYWIILALSVCVVQGTTTKIALTTSEPNFPPPPQTFTLKSEVTSGPVVLVDKKTLLVPNFRYRGDHQNVRFWVGNGTEPTTDGVPILDEKNSSESLQAYEGQNLYLHLPEGITTDNIEYFAVWSIDEETSLGHVPIKGISGVPDVGWRTKNPLGANNTMIVPKCCPDGFILTNNGCDEIASMAFEPKINVYEHNETHFRNESLDLSTIEFQTYTFALDCPVGKYPLDKETEEFALLLNGSLLVKGAVGRGIWSQDMFCLENIKESGTYQMKVFVCAPEIKIQKAMCYTYITFTIISTFCFAGTFIVYFFFFKIEDVHRKCFTGYVFEMMVVFLCLTIVQLTHVEGNGCKVLGFFFQGAMLASFTMLAILCFDIMIIVKYIDDDAIPKKRKMWYTIIAVGVPCIFMIISLLRNLTPDVPNSFFKPQYQTNSCYFESENQKVFLLFYIPIIASIVVSGVCLAWTKYHIVKNDRNKRNDYFWIGRAVIYKFMFRQCFLTAVIMTVVWISNVLMTFFDDSSGIVNAAILIESFQGVLIVLVFGMHHYGTTYVEKKRLKQSLVEMNPLNHSNHE